MATPELTNIINNKNNEMMPTIILVPGAWFPEQVYGALITSLKQQYQYECVVAPYPSINPQGDPSSTTCAVDTAYIRAKYLNPLVEQGKDIVVFGHSYGGMPGAGAATGLGKRTRLAAGKKGGVIGLIMASGFVVGEDISCAGAMGGSLPDWILQDNPSRGLCIPDNPHEMFQADVDKAKADDNLKMIVPHSTLAFFSPQPKPAFSDDAFQDLCAYIKLMQDEAVPVQGQEAMLQYSGAEWITKELQMSHNAGFVTRTDEMAATIAELVRDFQSKA